MSIHLFEPRRYNTAPIVNTAATATPPKHTPSLLEQMGIGLDYDGVAACTARCNSKAVFTQVYKDGSHRQIKPAEHPIPGFLSVDQWEAIYGTGG